MTFIHPYDQFITELTKLMPAGTLMPNHYTISTALKKMKSDIVSEETLKRASDYSWATNPDRMGS